MALDGLPFRRINSLLDSERNWEWLRAHVSTGTGGAGFTIVDAKGDLIVGISDDTVDRLGVGTDGEVLTADSASPTGVKWDTAGAAAFDEPFVVAMGGP